MKHGVNKKKYQSPKINLIQIVIDDSFANASSTITFGEINQEYQPDVQDWTNETNHSNYDF